MPYCFITCIFRDFISFVILFLHFFLLSFFQEINPVRMKIMGINSNLFWILLNTFELSGLEEMNEKNTTTDIVKKFNVNCTNRYISNPRYYNVLNLSN